MPGSDKSITNLQITRLATDTTLVPPLGYYATVVLKAVERDDGRPQYAWWTMVGRRDTDAATVAYKHTGEDVIRCDLGAGVALSRNALEAPLASFLASEGVFEPAAPIIVED